MMSTVNKSSTNPSPDVVLVSKKPQFQTRAQSLKDEFGFVVFSVNGVDELMDQFSENSPRFIILSTEDIANKDEASGMVQVAKQVSPNGFILVVLGDKLDNSALGWIRKSGADVVILESEYFDTSKLEFFAFQSVNLAYQTIKPGDFIEGSSLNFVVYHFLPQNRKYLPVIHKGTKIEEKKILKMKEAGDVYIKRSDIDAYYKYVSTTHDQSAKGLVSRCRGEFLKLSESYFDLIVSLTEQTDKPSFDEGKKILQTCQTMAADLLNSLMTVGQVQLIVGSPQTGDFGSVERGPERAALVGFFSMLAGIGKPEDVMLSALLMDIGILGLKPQVLKKLRKKEFESFLKDEKVDYELHPQKSLNYALSRKLQLNNTVKDAIYYSHSRCDFSGFPQVNFEKISLEAQLLRFAEEVDMRMEVQLGRPRPNFKDVFSQYISENAAKQTYSLKLLTDLKGMVDSL